MRRHKRGCKKKRLCLYSCFDVVCDFKNLLCDNPVLEDELCSHPYVKHSPINIRDALYGGRTDATKTYYRVKQGVEIRYVDVISLYPYILRYGKFLVGHPKVYVGEECPLTVWIGM